MLTRSGVQQESNVWVVTTWRSEPRYLNLLQFDILKVMLLPRLSLIAWKCTCCAHAGESGLAWCIWIKIRVVSGAGNVLKSNCD